MQHNLGPGEIYFAPFAKPSYLKRLGITAWHLLTAWVTVPECARAFAASVADIFRPNPSDHARRVHGIGYALLIALATFLGLVVAVLMPLSVIVAPAWLWFIDRRVREREDFARYYGGTTDE